MNVVRLDSSRILVHGGDNGVRSMNITQKGLIYNVNGTLETTVQFNPATRFSAIGVACGLVTNPQTGKNKLL